MACVTRVVRAELAEMKEKLVLIEGNIHTSERQLSSTTHAPLASALPTASPPSTCHGAAKFTLVQHPHQIGGSSTPDATIGMYPVAIHHVEPSIMVTSGRPITM